MKVKILIATLVLMLILSNALPVTRLRAETEVLCQPGAYEVKSYSTTVIVQGGTLDVRFYFPDATRPAGDAQELTNYFAENTLSGVIVMPPSNFTGTDPQDVLVEDTNSQAANLAAACHVAMVLRRATL